MAVLSDANRAEAWAVLMRLPKGDTGNWAVVKADLRTALNAVDSWVDSNFTSFSDVLPESLRVSASANRLLANVAAIARGGTVSDVSEGVADRSQSASLLAGYNAASDWLINNVTSLLTAVNNSDLTSAQTLLVLQQAALKRAEVANG